jgi:hypothetical protein
VRYGKHAPGNDDFEEIVENFARAIFASAWANAYEEGGGSFSPGTEIFDVCPFEEHHQWEEALQAAERAVTEIERDNKTTITEAYERAAAKPLTKSWHKEADIEDFGHYLGMQWLGSGVRWSDDHPDHDLKIPYGEFYVEYEEYTYPDEDELRQSVVISDEPMRSKWAYSVACEGKIIDHASEWDEAVQIAIDYMDREKYWPNLYHINDHGNISLLDKDGNEITGWV